MKKPRKKTDPPTHHTVPHLSPFLSTQRRIYFFESETKLKLSERERVEILIKIFNHRERETERETIKMTSKDDIVDIFTILCVAAVVSHSKTNLFFLKSNQTQNQFQRERERVE